MPKFLFATLLVTSFAALAIAQEEPAAKPEQALVGKWKLVETKSSGPAKNNSIGAILTLTADGKAEFSFEGKTKAGTYSVDATKTPAQFRLKPEGAAEESPAIFRIERERLQICASLKKGGAPPADFNISKDQDLGLMIFERVKEK